MRIRWLGWAGVELTAHDATLVIDPLADAAAVFAALGPDRTIALPEVVAPTRGTAVAGLVTHLHRDHADAAALTGALRPGAPVLEPDGDGGDEVESLALAQAAQELVQAGLERRRMRSWQNVEAGPFRVTALPAVDGIGDPQVSWVVEGDGVRVLHLGDTIFHGYWWRMARRCGPFDAVLVPVNGAVLSFPHRRPASPLAGALDPEQAAIAAQILGARLAIPIHAEGYAVAGVYEPVVGAVEKFTTAAAARDVATHVPGLGESIQLV
jgi:L-ascorbate metabolism protein UlaG (beta-lactamase superfamily)